MNNSSPLNRFYHFEALGRSGTPETVDMLMLALIQHDNLATTKLVDYALGLVNTPSGTARIEYYLFQGVQVQRNYAALYFKRRGFTDLLEQALAKALISFEQGFLT
jgi:hypothetical protein